MQAIAAIHARAWRESYGGVLPPVMIAALETAALSPVWSAAVTAAPTPRHRVLVSTSSGMITGFAAVAPAGDPDLGDDDVELVALEVDPAHRGTGHGSRLLNAAVDTSRDQGSARIHAWVPAVDAARATFLQVAGLVADGAERVTADDQGSTWVERRMVAALDSSV